MGKRFVSFQIKISHQRARWIRNDRTGPHLCHPESSPQTGDAPHSVAGYAAKAFLSFAAGILSPRHCEPVRTLARQSALFGSDNPQRDAREACDAIPRLPTRRAGSVRRDTSLANATRGERATRHLACQRDAREAWPDIFSSGLPVECSLLNRRDAIPPLSRTFRRRRRARKAKRYLNGVFFLLPFFLLQEKERMGKRSVPFQLKISHQFENW